MCRNGTQDQREAVGFRPRDFAGTNAAGCAAAPLCAAVIAQAAKVAAIAKRNMISSLNRECGQGPRPPLQLHRRRHKRKCLSGYRDIRNGICQAESIGRAKSAGAYACAISMSSQLLL